MISALGSGFSIRIEDPTQHLVDRSGEFGTPPAAGSPTACVIPGPAGYDIAYRDTWGRLHELWRDAQGLTGTTNLTANAGAPTAVGNPFAYVDTSRNTEILLYRGGDGTVRSLYWSTGPVGDDNLSDTAGAPKAAGDPVGYYTPAADTHHVIYRTGDGHLHELCWIGVTPVGYGGNLTGGDLGPFCRGRSIGVRQRGGQQHRRLPQRTTATSSACTGRTVPAASMICPALPAHRRPRATRSPTTRLTTTPTRSSIAAVTGTYTSSIGQALLRSSAGTSRRPPRPRAAGNPAAYYSAGTNTKHVIYRSADGRLHEIWWVPGAGHRRTSTSPRSSRAPPAADRPAAFTVEGPNTQHVAYRGTDGHIYEVIW